MITKCPVNQIDNKFLEVPYSNSDRTPFHYIKNDEGIPKTSGPDSSVQLHSNQDIQGVRFLRLEAQISVPFSRSLKKLQGGQDLSSPKLLKLSFSDPKLVMPNFLKIYFYSQKCLVLEL